MFDGFIREQIKTQETTINLVRGGSGDPVLLLHGYPQTHVCWHLIAPKLAEQFTVVCSDLRGFGDSGKPPSDPQYKPIRASALLLARMAYGIIEAHATPKSFTVI